MEFQTEERVQEVLLHMTEPLKKAVLTFIFTMNCQPNGLLIVPL